MLETDLRRNIQLPISSEETDRDNVASKKHDARFVVESVVNLLHLPEGDRAYLEADFLQQIEYITKRLIIDFQDFVGFSKDLATKMAKEIAPQAYMFVIAVRLKAQGKGAFIPSRPPIGAGEIWSPQDILAYQEARNEETYLALRMGIMAYGFDRIVDKDHAREENRLQHVVDRASEQLLDDPEFYSDHLTALLEFVWGHLERTGKKFEDDPEGWNGLTEEMAAFGPLIGFIEFAYFADVPKKEVAFIFYSYVDTISYGQIPQVWWKFAKQDTQDGLKEEGIHLPQQKVKVRPDAIEYMQMGNINGIKELDLDQALAWSLLNNQGIILIAQLNYMLSCLEPKYNRQKQKFDFEYKARGNMSSFAEQIACDDERLGGKLVAFARVCAGLIRILDDHVDFYRDRGQIQADGEINSLANLFLANKSTRIAFLEYSGIKRLESVSMKQELILYMPINIPIDVISYLIFEREHFYKKPLSDTLPDPNEYVVAENVYSNLLFSELNELMEILFQDLLSLPNLLPEQIEIIRMIEAITSGAVASARLEFAELPADQQF